MRKICYLVLAAMVTGCAVQPGKSTQAVSPGQPAAPRNAAATNGSTAPDTSVAGPSLYPSTYKAPSSAPTLIRHTTVLTGTGTRLDAADVLLADGKIQAVGNNLQAPANTRVVDGDGLWVTPGLIDVHSHLGVYPSPQVNGNSDGNGRHYFAADPARLGQSHRRPLGGVEKRPQRDLHMRA